MGVSYAEIEYMYTPKPVPRRNVTFQLEGIHFIVIYIFALFVMSFSK